MLKVFRSGVYIKDVSVIRRSQNELEYVEGVLQGDVLVAEDGAKLKVVWNNNNSPGGKRATRDGLRFELQNTD